MTPENPSNSSRWGLILAAVIVVGAGVWYYVANRPVENENASTNTTAQTKTVSVYFGSDRLNPGQTDCSLVFPVNRTVATSNVPLTTAQALFEGPSAAERADGYTSQLSSETRSAILSVKVSNRVAYVNVSDLRTVIPNASASCASVNLLASINRTLTGLSNIDNVVVAINANPRTFYEWLQLDCPAASNNCDTSPFK